MTGNTREERLAGQAATDESLRFEMLKKLQDGKLTESDLPALKALVQVLKNNQEMFDTLAPSDSSLEALADDKKWKAARTGFEQAIARFSKGSGDPGAQGVGRTVTVNINAGKGKRETVNTDEAGAAALVRSLEHAASRS